jgi:bleomycin hydrolase
MMKATHIVIGMAVSLLGSWPLLATEPRPHKVKYVTKRTDPATEEIREQNRQAREQRQAETDAIRSAQNEARERKRKEQKEIRFDFSGVQKPASPDAFETAFHFPPVRQFLTGTCWCFSTTSFFESEVHRLTGRSIRLSEMFTVYYEYLEEARRYVQQRGDSFFDEGSEGNAVMLVWREYGVVPAAAYQGENRPDGRYDHSEMAAEMKQYLQCVYDHDEWDEERVLASLRLIMDQYMGPPPERFMHEDVEMTPRQFLSDVLKLNLDDYVCVMSTLSQPFYAFGEYEVEANWWHSRDYYNVPLDQFYEIIRYAVQNGYTVRLNGDVTEPGYDGFEDAAVIPTFDIPVECIDQDARELRFLNRSTTDDHDVHLVGWTRMGDQDWYLVKDSADEGHQGQFKGYLFYREDYIKLKTLTYIVHKDAVRAVVKDFGSSAGFSCPPHEESM